MTSESTLFQRRLMVRAQIAARGIVTPRVLRAFEAVPREAFVPRALQSHAYDDAALPIEEGQTISQPYVVALMIDALRARPGDRVLEIGAGSGYAAAVLSRVVAEVYTVERNEVLARLAQQRCRALGYQNVQVREGDGTLGWPAHAPFDGILVAAGGPAVPPSLRDQLAIGGRLVIPVGTTQRDQELVLVQRLAQDEYRQESLGPVSFVPLIGAEGWSSPGSS